MTSKGGPIAVGVAGALGMLMVGLSVLGGAMENTDDSKPAGSSTALNADKVPPEYVDWIIRAGTTCDGVSAPLIAAQISAESNWNPNAKSPVGAQGLSQFMPGTWVSWGVDADKDGKADPFTPADAIMTQARYDCWLMKKVRSYHLDGDPTRLMLAAYNAGPGAVEQYGGIPPYIETQTYVERIMERVAQYSRIEEGTTPAGRSASASPPRPSGGSEHPTRGAAEASAAPPGASPRARAPSDSTARRSPSTRSTTDPAARSPFPAPASTRPRKARPSPATTPSRAIWWRSA